MYVLCRKKPYVKTQIMYITKYMGSDVNQTSSQGRLRNISLDDNGNWEPLTPRQEVRISKRGRFCNI